MITGHAQRLRKVLTNQYSVTNEYHIKNFSKAFILIVTDFHSGEFHPEDLAQNG